MRVPDSVPDEEALFLSDILATSYHQVKDTGVEQGDVVGIWGVGAIGLMVAKWAELAGASRIIIIDNVDWRLQHCKSKVPMCEIVNFDENKDVVKKINEMTAPGTHAGDSDKTRPAGLDVAFECAAGKWVFLTMSGSATKASTPGEYPKSMMHKIEVALSLETDTSEIVNELIMSVRPFGRCGVVSDILAGLALRT